MDAIERTAVQIRIDLEMRRVQAKRMLELLCGEANVDAGMGLDLIDRMVQFQLGVLSCDPKAIETRMKGLLKHPFSKYVEEKGLPKELKNIGLAKVRENVLKGGGKKASFAKKMLQRVKRVYDSMDEEDKAYLHTEAKKTFLKGGAGGPLDKCRTDNDCTGNLECGEDGRCRHGLGEDCLSGTCKKPFVCSTETNKCVTRGRKSKMADLSVAEGITVRERLEAEKWGSRAASLFLLAIVVAIICGLFILGPEGAFSTLNQQFRTLYRIDDVEMAQTNMFEWVGRTGGQTMMTTGVLAGAVMAPMALIGLPVGLGFGTLTLGGAALWKAGSGVNEAIEKGGVAHDATLLLSGRAQHYLCIKFYVGAIVVGTQLFYRLGKALNNRRSLTAAEYSSMGLLVVGFLQEGFQDQTNLVAAGLVALGTIISPLYDTIKNVLKQDRQYVENVQNKRIENKTNIEKEKIKADTDIEKEKIKAYADVKKEEIRAASPKKESPGCILPKNGRRCRKIKDGEEDDGNCVWNPETNRCNKKKRRRAAEETKEEYHGEETKEDPPALPDYDDDDLANVD